MDFEVAEVLKGELDLEEEGGQGKGHGRRSERE